jgi:Ser/Thr protein kinase RdoA (MazF antagonist)
MRPLSPAERAALLADHPGTTEQDLARLEELSMQAFYGAGPEDAETRASLERELEEFQRRVFPRMGEALARARGAEA